MTIQYATRYRTRSFIPPEPGKPYLIEKGQGVTDPLKEP